MNWRVKGLVQKVLTHVPRGEHLHHRLQRRFGALNQVNDEADSKVEDWRLMMGYLRTVGATLKDARLMEIGTGWYPLFPWCCVLAGAAQVVTFDLNRLLKEDLTQAAVARLEHHLPLIADEARVPLDEVRARHVRMRDALRARFDLGHATAGVIEYRAPADACRTGLRAGSIDLVFSNSVLEHVPPPVVADMFKESDRVLSPEGLMVHGVNCGDHYAYVDRSISQLNYLRYSDHHWAIWNNGFLYQNRLRAHQFIEIVRAAGFEVLLDTARPSERRLRELDAVPVHPQFQRFSREELCVTSIDFVARRARAVTT